MSDKLSENSKKVMDLVEKMTVLELNDLVKALEEKFGVTAAAPVMVAGGAVPAAAGPAVEEKTEFDVVLKAAGAHINKQEQVVQTVPFEAKQNGTNPIIQATLIDGISSYA